MNATASAHGNQVLVLGTGAGLFIAVLFLVLLPWAVARSGSKWMLWLGEDGRPSTSKFQFFLWTFAVLWGYGLLYIVQIFTKDSYQAIDPIPSSLLAAMGVSALTMVTAKAITTSYVAAGKVDKTRVAGAPAGGLLTNDQGEPDLGKIQLMAFTSIALAIFVAQVYSSASRGECALPDIAMSLVALMGIGHGTYLGKKLVTTETPAAGKPPASAP